MEYQEEATRGRKGHKAAMKKEDLKGQEEAEKTGPLRRRRRTRRK